MRAIYLENEKGDVIITEYNFQIFTQPHLHNTVSEYLPVYNIN